MSNKNNNQNLIAGAAAIVAGIVGTLSALIRSNRKVSWKEQAKDVANHVFEKSGEKINKNMLLGGVACGIIGAVTALLLAPKSGSDLIKDLAHPFSEGSHKRSTARKTTSRKSASSRKGSAKHQADHKEALNSEEHKSHKSSTKRKSTARRRTAATSRKRATAANERAASEASATS